MPSRSQSNIFGITTTSSSTGTTEPVSAETTAAGKLIDHLKWIADNAIETAANRAEWLAITADQGQNTDPNGLVKRELTQPEALSRASVLSGWDLPAIASSPLTLPTIPDNLVVDFEKLKTDAAADLSALQGSWLARYLPEVTDVTRLDELFKDVLDGTYYDSAKAKLDGLEEEAKAALIAIRDTALADLTSSITSAKANIAANYADAQTNLQGALDTAMDNTTNIAWTRARDQAAREAARQESEAVSLWASRGFTLPGGALTAISRRAQQATLTAAVDVAGQQAEKTQQMSFDVAKATVDAWLRNMDAQANAEISAFKEYMGARLRYSEIEAEVNTTVAKQALDHLQLRMDFSKFSGDLAAKYRLGVIEGMNSLIRAWGSLRGNETEYLNSIARAEREAQTAVLDYYRAAMAAAEIGMKVDVVNNETSLRWAEIAARFIGTAVGHHVQAASTAAEVFSRTAGMALSGLNGIASVVKSE